MKLTLRFEFYTEEELTTLLRHRCKALGWEVDQEVLPLIAHRSRGTPRLHSDCCKPAAAFAEARGNTRLPSRISIVLASWNKSTTWALDQWSESTLRSWPMAGSTERHFHHPGLANANRVRSHGTIPDSCGLIDKDQAGLRQLTAKGLEHVRSK